jgi:hypothetical protein
MLQSAKQIGASLVRILFFGLSRKSVFVRTIILVLSGAVFFLDLFIICDGSEQVDSDKSSQTYRPKPIYVVLLCLGIVSSFLLVGYFLTTGGDLGSTGSTDVITYTAVELPDPESEEAQAAARETRRYIRSLRKSLGDSSYDEK